MKETAIGLSHKYVTALQKHLRPGSRASLRPARELGCLAAALALETLDLARIHDAALASLPTSCNGGGAHKRAEKFFAEAIIPIEETHRTALKANARLSRLNQRLGRRTTDLAASCRTVKQGVVKRRTLKEAGEHARQLLNESRRLQKHLHHLTYQILSAGEDQRKAISHELQDEIAQTLLSINVRLVALKKEAEANAHGLEREIAGTEQMVEVSVKNIKRVAREIGGHHQPQPRRPDSLR